MKSRRERPWDAVIRNADKRKLIFARRLGTPDGVRRGIRVDRGRRFYPWGELEDGDYFVADVQGSRASMLTAFKQGAVRHDMEIAVHDVSEEYGSEYFRVTRVMGNIKRIKEKARALGLNAPHFDMRAYYRRRREEATSGGPGTYTPGTPVDALRDPSPPAPEAYDREARMAAVRRAAMEELE